MGETPEIPETLSEEGKEFLQQVFVHDPTGNHYNNSFRSATPLGALKGGGGGGEIKSTTFPFILWKKIAYCSHRIQIIKIVKLFIQSYY